MYAETGRRAAGHQRKQHAHAHAEQSRACRMYLNMHTRPLLADKRASAEQSCSYAHKYSYRRQQQAADEAGRASQHKRWWIHASSRRINAIKLKKQPRKIDMCGSRAFAHAYKVWVTCTHTHT
eukprot:scpid105244/ scgid31855/ 